MNKEICKGCGNVDCNSACNALEELYKVKRQIGKKETRRIMQELRQKLETQDCETADDLTELAKSVINEHIDELGFIEDMEIQIGFIRSYMPKNRDGKTIYADTEKTKYKYTAFIPYDFIITFYQPNCDMLNDEQMRILMWHELKHIGIGDKGLKLMPHDIEEFVSIIDSHGMFWNNPLGNLF